MKVKVLVALALLVYLMTGLYFVAPDEQGVVCRFGAIVGKPREPGPHFGCPAGLDRVIRVKPREAKRVTIGLPESSDGSLATGAAQFLTGDRNLVNVQATVEYTVRDPRAYLFGSVSVDDVIAQAAESVLAAKLASESVDRMLTEGKQELALNVADGLSELVGRYGLGVQVRSVDIALVGPPPEVSDAFDAVISALRQSEQMVNEAKGYSARILTEARGEEQREIAEAEAYRDRLVLEAEGEADRFGSLVAEYRGAPDLTAQRLYLETMQEILPRFRSKLILDSENALDLSIFEERDRGEGGDRSRSR